MEHYLETWNATEAARRAGYRGNDVTLASVGYENVRKPQVAEAIKRRLAEKAMTADEALSRLADVARGNLGRYVTVSATGKIGLDYQKLTDERQLHLIKSVATNKDGELGRVEFYSALQALELILKATGVFDDGVTINLPPFDPEEWKKKAEERLREIEDLDDPYESEGDADPE